MAYSKEEFDRLSKRECKNIGELTGRYYYIKPIGDKGKYDIFYGTEHVLQGDDLSYLLGYLHGLRSGYEERKGK